MLCSNVDIEKDRPVKTPKFEKIVPGTGRKSTPEPNRILATPADRIKLRDVVNLSVSSIDPVVTQTTLHAPHNTAEETLGIRQLSTAKSNVGMTTFTNTTLFRSASDNVYSGNNSTFLRALATYSLDTLNFF